MWERADLQRVQIYLKAQVRPPLLGKYLDKETLQSHERKGSKQLPRTGSFQFLCPRADPVTQLPVHKLYLERTGHPGVLTHRLVGVTNHDQRQQDQLKPQITTLQETSTRTQATETKATRHHQNPVLQPQQVLDTPNKPESQDFDLKIISHNDRVYYEGHE